MWNTITPKDNTVVFRPRDAVVVNGHQEYVVPKGATALHILCIGAGGPGGSGFGAAAGTARGGGGGGGSGGLSRSIIPTFYLPQVLFVQPGVGPGGTGNSIVRVSPTAGLGANVVVFAAQGGTGGNGTATAAGAAGAAAAIATNNNTVYGCYGAWVPTSGMAGGAGGAHTGAVGFSVPFGGNWAGSGGAGGAGCTAAEFAGGAITGAGPIQTVPGGGPGAIPGNAGATLLRPLSYTGGSGGGSSNTAAGAAGGDGAPGCGGGGGGAGVTTGGLGGRGGPGVVIITAVF